MIVKGVIVKMIPSSFEYFAPKKLEEAISLLGKYRDEAKILAGGQSLIPLMKLRLASPGYIVDLNGIGTLEYIRESGGYLRIGSLTRMAEIETSDLIRTRHPIIHDAASHIADPLVRNLGTAGGNVAHGDPGNDLPAVMLALDAEFHVVSPRGERDIKADGFFVDIFTTALEPDEILSEIRVPIPATRSGGAYLKLEKRVGDFAMVGVATQVTLDSQGACQRVGIGLTSVGPTALKAKRGEEYLRGKKLDENAIRKAADLTVEHAKPTSDLRGPSEYKRDMVRVLTIRALKKSLQRAAGVG